MSSCSQFETPERLWFIPILSGLTFQTVIIKQPGVYTYEDTGSHTITLSGSGNFIEHFAVNHLPRKGI